MTTSIRLTPQLEQLISHLARTRKQTKSEVIRQALMTLAEHDAAASVRPQTPYDSMKHLLGCATGGPPDLSTDSGKNFRSLLHRKQAAQ